MKQTVGAKTDCELLEEFEKKREELGLTKSEAVREALRLFVRDKPPK